MSRFDQQLPSSASNSAAEEANGRTCSFVGTTDRVLAYAGSIAKALTEERIALEQGTIAQRFVTRDNPEGFFLRVTDHTAMWVVAEWGAYQAFEDAGVSFCRTMDPETIAFQ